MGVICKYGAKECDFCEACFNRNRSEPMKTCQICGELLDSDKVRSRGAFTNLCDLCYNEMKYGGI